MPPHESPRNVFYGSKNIHRSTETRDRCDSGHLSVASMPWLLRCISERLCFYTHVIVLLRLLHDEFSYHGGVVLHQIGENICGCPAHLNIIHSLGSWTEIRFVRGTRASSQKSFKASLPKSLKFKTYAVIWDTDQVKKKKRNTLCILPSLHSADASRETHTYNADALSLYPHIQAFAHSVNIKSWVKCELWRSEMISFLLNYQFRTCVRPFITTLFTATLRHREGHSVNGQKEQCRHEQSSESDK